MEAKEKSASPEKQLASIAIRAAVTIDFSQWLEALFISLKYRRVLAESRARVPAAQRRRGRGVGARAAAAEPRQQPEPVLHLPP